jgi:hypothetical protein
MKRRTRLAMTLAAGALLAGLAVPAHAAGSTVLVGKTVTRIPININFPGQTQEARCSVHSDGGFFPPSAPYDFEFTGIGYYTSAGPAWRRWTSFRYRLDDVVTGLGNKSNVNIRVLDGYVERMDMDSPDNRVPGVWYTVVPETGSVYTQTAGNDDSVEFEAIFDRDNHSDPRCFVHTPRI